MISTLALNFAQVLLLFEIFLIFMVVVKRYHSVFLFIIRWNYLKSKTYFKESEMKKSSSFTFILNLLLKRKKIDVLQAAN
jgi:hypothetical protein